MCLMLKQQSTDFYCFQQFIFLDLNQKSSNVSTKRSDFIQVNLFFHSPSLELDYDFPGDYYDR